MDLRMYHIQYLTDDGRQVDLWYEFHEDKKTVYIHGRVGDEWIDESRQFTYLEDARDYFECKLDHACEARRYRDSPF